MNIEDFERALDRLLEMVESGRTPGREELEEMVRQGGFGSVRDVEETAGMIRRLRLGSEGVRIPADLDRRLLDSLDLREEAAELHPLGREELKLLIVKCFKDASFREALLLSPGPAATEFGVALTGDQHRELGAILTMDWSIRSEEQLEARVSSILLRFFG